MSYTAQGEVITNHPAVTHIIDPSLGFYASPVTYPVASDSEWRVTEEWRSIKVFSHNSLYTNRVFLLLLLFTVS